MAIKVMSFSRIQILEKFIGGANHIIILNSLEGKWLGQAWHL